MFLQLLGSSAGSVLAFGGYLATSSLLDRFVEPTYANGGGLLASTTINFGMQRAVFAPGAAMSNVIYRYVIAEAIIVASQQGVFLGLLPFQRRIEQYVGAEEDSGMVMAGIRSASQASVFALISFPLRRHWVFQAGKAAASKAA
eukprot:CAMPEP_0206445870 /NCGR_PEP_ID=MMETSP0324_2-20121206/15785_1 /ASSEMBLY_ACC=CAM_ASM_000836 /TAXON_ID=2866 /ORGANISM="Crypthecodinium cohnii, Strain Seligo" /LENGTH=143 /DNA_ID=CAMNT_0053914207 /DNA_START=98 /DNA_END=529 /DNA_ORIENTATION=+